MKKNDYLQDHLEWEVIELDQEITHLTFETKLYNLSNDCIIKFTRDNQYNLIATISGIANKREDLQPKIKSIVGTFILEETIIGYSEDRLYKYKLSGVVLGSSKYALISMDKSTIKFESNLTVNKIEKAFIGQEIKKEIIQEWFLTGNTNINFTRSTSRSIDKFYKRLRDGVDPENKTNLIQSCSDGRDYLLVKIPNTSFIVSKVPKEYGPEWSFSISIEYRKSLGEIPDESERIAISEIVGFIFGNQLLKIGQTSYDELYSNADQEYQSPWGDNVISRCQRYGSPPVNIGDYNDYGRVEILLNDLIPIYLKKRKELRLTDALWKYWLSIYSTLGTNLPILSSAVETLAERILKNNHKIKNYYIEPKEFSKLIKDELTSIEKKIDTIQQKGIILNKIKGASQRGTNERLELMFEIIGLPIGNVERKAIKSRNKMAHSSFGEISCELITETMRMTKAYETLFHRVLLKILSYNNHYIDYYTLGYPNRDIHKPIPD